MAERDLLLDLPRPPPDCRVAVAMSGGVDSSVVAALLVEAGVEVVGITLQLYDHAAATAAGRGCCAGRDIHDARMVADRLGIAHFVLDFEERFKAAVIDDFAATYARGRTPVPCVRCNERVKFGDLLAIARDLGADALATGHYARRVPGPGGPELHRARDVERDQSYFLFTLSPDQLSYLRFPLGGLTKRETRGLAERFGLAVAAKPDSQDICFIPQGHYSDLVARLRPEAARPGEIVDADGRTVGRHDGVARFTVGQRRGLGVAAAERLYVVGIDPARARIVVGPRRQSLCREIGIDEVNWLAGAPVGSHEVMVRHRYNEPAVAGRVVEVAGDTARVTFDEPQAGVAPGQACVLYRDSRVLGGGWIAEAPVLAAIDRREAAAASA